MADEYTPTTEDVREAASLNGGIAVEPDAFNRWLAQHDAQVKAEAWDEALGYASIHFSGEAEEALKADNPYRDGGA